MTLLCPGTHQAKTHPRILIKDSHLPLVQCPKILGVYLDTSIIQLALRLRYIESIQQKQYPQCLGSYILRTTEGNMTNGLQGSREIDHQHLFAYKHTLHKLHKHPIYTKRGSEYCHWLSQDVQTSQHCRTNDVCG